MFKDMLEIIKCIFGKKCTHPSINPFNDGKFCPDCGKQIKIYWLTLKCAYCNNTRQIKINKYGQIIPTDNFCSNCGSAKWFSVKDERINLSESFNSLPFKQIVNNEYSEFYPKSKTNVWIERVKQKKAP